MAPARSSAERRPARLSFVALLIALATLFVSSPADAQGGNRANGWRLCNRTSFILEAASGRPDGRAIVVQGWIRLRPGECKTAAPQPLPRSVHYVYARTSTAHRGGRRQWGGDVKLCVDPTASFAIENPPNCKSQSLEQREFRRVQINKRDTWVTNFAEGNSTNLYAARSRGLERLLADAGYDTVTASGRDDPRRVAIALARFRQEARIPAGASEDQMIDALETAARRRAAAIGLTLCNRTTSRIWSAVARRRGEGWESRGWWQLSPGGCARAIDDPLLQNVYFVHALMETPQGERYLAAAGESFCTSPTKFAVLGRDRCAQRYFDETLFSAISSDGREGLVVEFADSDFLAPGIRPQRSSQTRADEAAPTGRSPEGDQGQTPPARRRAPAQPKSENGRVSAVLPGQDRASQPK